MAASTVPAAKQAVLTMLAALPALNTVGITWSEPTEQEDMLPDLIFFDGPVIRQPRWGALAATAPVDEEYTLTLQVRSYTPGDDRQTAEQRGWDLIALIEQAVRTDYRLGGLIRLLEFGEQEIRSLPESDGFSVAGFVPLVCTARI